MATKARSKPFDRFGRYILFKKLDTHALGEMWRAGSIEGNELGPVVALHRLSGGDRAAFAEAAEGAASVVSQLSGGTFVKNQVITVVDDVPVVVHEYSGGRTLRHIIDRARGSATSPAQPIPTDQALSIAERVAASVESMNGLKVGGNRLNHGAILPHFIWITDDGDVRTAGQNLGKGIVASLRKGGEVSAEISPYVAPEIRENGEPTKASDIYTLGAILYLCLTSQEPPDPSAGAVDTALANATLAVDSKPIPPEIRTILHKSLVLNQAERYAAAADFRQALSQLLHGGEYAPTTFNLAFYLHTLLRKEMEGEVVEREKESKVSVAQYLAELNPAAAVVSGERPSAPVEPSTFATPTFGSASEPAKNKTPMIAAAIAFVLLGGGAVAYLMSRKPAPVARPAAQAAPVIPLPAAAPPPVAPVVSAAPATTTPSTSTDDARKKAIEDEVNRRLQTEVQKLQADYNKKLDQKPVAAAMKAPAVAKPEQAPPSAAQLDENRRPQPARTETVAAAIPPASQPAVTATQAAAPPPVAAAPVAQTREGDLVNSSDVDEPPRVVRQVKPTYPTMAERQKIEDVVIVSALVSENGKVLDVKILRGESKPFGFNDAALRAIRSFTFAPATKDGKRVRTWFPVPFKFSLH